MTYSDSLFEAYTEILKAATYYRSWNSQVHKEHTIKALTHLLKVIGDCDHFDPNQTPLKLYTEKATRDYNAAIAGRYFTPANGYDTDDESNKCI
jgi:hypothetical protein